MYRRNQLCLEGLVEFAHRLLGTRPRARHALFVIRLIACPFLPCAVSQGGIFPGSLVLCFWVFWPMGGTGWKDESREVGIRKGVPSPVVWVASLPAAPAPWWCNFSLHSQPFPQRPGWPLLVVLPPSSCPLPTVARQLWDVPGLFCHLCNQFPVLNPLGLKHVA